jgi:hypothetical protein
MNPDELKQAWQTQSSQTRLTIDADLLLKEVRRNQQRFRTTIFWRDVREVGTSLLMVPLWIYLGVRLSLPWTWYLMVPALLWIAGYMLTDRKWHKRQLAGPGEPLSQCVQSSLAEVEHQIWLLRNVFWWYLLPPSLAMLAIFSQIAWQMRAGGWFMAVFVALMVMVEGVVFGGIYLVNQHAVRSELEPRREELETLLVGLKDETPGVD